MAQVTYQIANLLEKMTSADKDYRFMATNDLMSELQKDVCKLDDDSERKVVKMLLKLLEDKNGEVQNLAVKCLGPLVNKVKEYQVETIVDTLCANMISESELLRDVSSIGLKTVICELPPSSSVLASGVCKRITPKLTQAIVKSDDMTVRVESLDILGDLLLRFGGMLVSFQPSIQEALLPQLSSPRLAVRKRAITAIGHLVVTCSNPIFERIMQFLLEELKRKSNISTTRTYVCCIAAVSKAAGHRFGDYLPEVMDLLVEFCNKEDDDELREFCIQAFESFILRCPKEIGPQVDTIIKLCSKFLCHDPNYHYDDDAEVMDVDGKNGDFEDSSGDEDEGQEYSDDEDMSWKVRRAAAKCLEAVLVTRREKLVSLYATVSPLLISRFKEREENVRTDILHAYLSLLKHTKVAAPYALLPAASQIKAASPPVSPAIIGAKPFDKTSFVASSQEAELLLGLLQKQVPALVKALTKQLREKSVKTRQACFALFHELLCVLPGALADHFHQLLPGIQVSLLSDKQFNSNIKIEALDFLETAFNTHKPSVFHPLVPTLVPLVVGMVKDSFYKVVAEALCVVQALVRVIRPFEMPSAFEFTPFVTPLYQCVFQKLLATDIDQEVKEKAITCMGQLICSFGDFLNGELSKCLPIMLERLKNEITRLVAVKAITIIALSPLKIDLRLILSEAMPELASFLRKNQRSLKLNTLQLLEALASNYSQAMKPELLLPVLTELPALIHEQDLQITQMSIRFLTSIQKFDPESISGILPQVLNQFVLLIQSAVLQGQSLEALLEFLQQLCASNAGPPYNELLKRVCGPVSVHGTNLHKQAFHNIARCVAVLVSANPQNANATVQQFLQQLKSGQSDAIRLLALLSLGEIGRTSPKSVESIRPELVVLEAFSSPNEDVKTAASFALGGIAAGNLAKYLPFVLSEIQSQPKRQYLLLHSLKEIICCTQKSGNHADTAEIIRPYINDIWSVLLEHSESLEEGTRNVVAECLGKLCLINPGTLLSKLKSCLSMPSPLARATVVTAVKFTIVDQPQAIDEQLRECIGDFLNTLGDEDLNVRRVALVAFNSAAHNKPSLVRDLLPTLLPGLYGETKVRKELVREVEMGPFKHTIDDGLDLRKAAFECMYTLLEACLERLDIFEFVNHVEDGLKDHYDIKMLTYLMLARLAALCPTQVLQRLERLVEPIRQTCVSKVKPNAVKQEYEKQDELKRSAMRALLALQTIPDSDKNLHLTELLNLIRLTQDLAALYDSVQKDPGSKAAGGDTDMDTS